MFVYADDVPKVYQLFSGETSKSGLVAKGVLVSVEPRLALSWFHQKTTHACEVGVGFG